MRMWRQQSRYWQPPVEGGPAVFMGWFATPVENWSLTILQIVSNLLREVVSADLSRSINGTRVMGTRTCKWQAGGRLVLT